MVVNPAGRVRAPRVERKAPTVWDATEIDKFLKAAGSNQFVEYFELAILTGLRRSEIAGLRWVNVDLDSKTSKILRVVETLQRVDGHGLVTGTPKSDRSRRVIALSPRAVSLLRSVRAKQSEQRLKAGKAWNESGGYVFTDAVGSPLDSGRVSKEFRRVANSIGSRGVTLHSLRHAHASLLISKGTHIKVVSERLGHTSTSFTLDTYAHLLPGMQEAAAEAIDAALAVR
jgi:integrase